MIQKPPRNEHELELRLVRLMGMDNARMLAARSLMANTIVGQFLPQGAVLKGGSSLRFRYGSGFSRNTMDFDTARSGDLDKFIREFRASLTAGWNGFSGTAQILERGNPPNVPFEYVMQPLDVKLTYKSNPWCSVRLEVSHSEVGAADGPEVPPLQSEVLTIFRDMGFPIPSPVPLMSLEHQVAQKLHAVSDPSERNRRAHDLIDLQIIVRNADLDLLRLNVICANLFRFRKRHPWATEIVKRPDWDGIYHEQMRNLEVLPTCDEAIAWCNAFMRRIEALDMAQRR